MLYSSSRSAKLKLLQLVVCKSATLMQQAQAAAARAAVRGWRSFSPQKHVNPDEGCCFCEQRNGTLDLKTFFFALLTLQNCPMREAQLAFT